MLTQIIAADGDLDHSFDGDGTVITDNNGSAFESIAELAVQPDGKIIAAGYSSNGINVARYNADGSLDSTFGTGGKTFIPSAFPSSLALQPDGKIVIAGSKVIVVTIESPINDFFVARLNSNGSFDTTFNGTGTLALDLRGGTNDIAHSVKLQPDGKIVLGGTSDRSYLGPRDYAIARLNPSGALDTTFDGDGKVFTITTNEGPRGFFGKIALKTDGKILATGSAYFSPASGLSGFAMVTVCYNADGSLDTSFDGDGMVFTQESGSDSFANSITTQPNGKILVAGRSRLNNTGQDRIFLVRFNTDGSLDFTFGVGGKSVLSGGTATDVKVQSDNKILISANFDFNQGNDLGSYGYVGRLRADGSPDPLFSGDGFNGFPFSMPTRHRANSVALQADGKVLIGGGVSVGTNDSQDFIVARFQSPICTTNCVASTREKIADFDGDGKTDLSVYRSGTWFINPSGANNPHSFYGVQFGLTSDKLIPADFDGDGKTDIAVWRENANDSLGYFYILQSSTNTFRVSQFGQTGDDPRVVGDWDGDGRADLAVYRGGANSAPQSFFFYRPSTQPSVDFIRLGWGTAGDHAVRGDFDGDRRMDAAVFRPAEGVWYVFNSSNGQVRTARWGLASDKLVAGDFDGDSRTDFAVYRDGFWAVLQSSNNQPRYENWGLSGDRVVAGDYDGDGKTDFAVWRAGVYYILPSSNSQPIYRYFGISTDIPIASAFIR